MVAWCKAVSVKDQNPWEEFFNVKVNEWDCEHCISTAFVFKDGLLFPKYFIVS